MSPLPLLLPMESGPDPAVSPPAATAHGWAATDAEAIRSALALPLNQPVLVAVEAAMAAVEQLQPSAISAVQQCLQEITALDQRLKALSPEQWQQPLEIQRKGAVPAVLSAALSAEGELPVRKADVIEYATELLLEQALLLMLPSLVHWRERLQSADPFTAAMARS